ncbi:PEP-CTERM sorting domain-containing protein [Psychromonas sp. MME2]
MIRWFGVVKEWRIDIDSIAVVSEPATISLLGLGLFVFALRKKVK